MNADETASIEEAERREIDRLLEKGMSFSVPKESLLRFFGSKERTFVFGEPRLGTFIALADQFKNIELSEEMLQENPLSESKRLAYRNSYTCAKIVAIAVLGSAWKIKLLTPFLTHYFLWRITPKKLLQLSILINTMGNFSDFINAIRYLKMSVTVTSPTRIAEKQED